MDQPPLLSPYIIEGRFISEQKRSQYFQGDFIMINLQNLRNLRAKKNGGTEIPPYSDYFRLLVGGVFFRDLLDHLTIAHRAFEIVGVEQFECQG